MTTMRIEFTEIPTLPTDNLATAVKHLATAATDKAIKITANGDGRKVQPLAFSYAKKYGVKITTRKIGNDYYIYLAR